MGSSETLLSVSISFNIKIAYIEGDFLYEIGREAEII